MDGNSFTDTNRTSTPAGALHPLAGHLLPVCHSDTSHSGRLGIRDVCIELDGHRDEKSPTFPDSLEPTAELTYTLTGQQIHARKADVDPSSNLAPDTSIQWHPETYQLHSKSQSDDAQRLADHLLATCDIDLPVRVICDLGCGTGNNLAAYGDKFQAKVIHAIEPRENMLSAIPTSDSDEVTFKPQEASARTFIVDPAQKPTVILTNHVFHWINPVEMPEVLQNIFSQMDDDGGYLAACYADSKQGLPFQTALDALKKQGEYQSYFDNHKPTQFFHHRETMVELLQATGFQNIHLDSNPVHKKFADRAALQGFVQQWLPEYHHLHRIAPDSLLAERFLTSLIDGYLAGTHQVNNRPIFWEEKSFTLLASKPSAIPTAQVKFLQ